MLKQTDQPEQQFRRGNETGRTMRSAGPASPLLRGLAQFALMALVLAGAFFLTNWLVTTRPEVIGRPVFPTVYTVDTMIAEKADHQPLIRVYGEVLAARSVDLRSLVAGEVIAVSDNLKTGGTVKKGETLLEIDAFEYEGALREARANKAETEARLDEANALLRLERARLERLAEQAVFARNDVERIRQLRERGAATEKQVEERALIVSQREQAVEQSRINIVVEEARVAQLRAGLERLDWRIEQSQRNLGNTKLIAPFDGTVRTSAAEIGKLVNANDVVVSLYETESLEARFVLTDARFARLNSGAEDIIGRPAEIVWTVGGVDYGFSGRIDRIGAEIASERGGVELFAAIDADDQPIGLRPGAFVEITLPDRLFAEHIRLPDLAVYNGNQVYLVENGELVARTVTIAAYDGDDVLVASGLEEGEEVLTTRIAEIGPGLKVRREGAAARPARRDSGGKGAS